MKYAFLVILFSVSIHLGFSQNNQLWKGYFSYNDIRDLGQSDNKLYAGSENAIFSKNTQTNEIKTISTIDGLSSQIISAIYHSTTLNKTLVGYENGLLTVINDSNGKILNVVDIINKQLPPNIKKINHFMEYNGIVYISCDFGILQYDLDKLQFGDTYFIGTTKSEIIVNQTTVLNGFLYASTQDEGIKKADITNPNLVDPGQWIQVLSGNFSGITSFSNSLFAISTSGQVLKSTNGTSFLNFGPALSPAAIDVRDSSDNLIITSSNIIYIYNSQLVLNGQISSTQIPDLTSAFTCATAIGSSVYIGTKDNGVVAATLTNPSNFEAISPSGPSKNNMFSITAADSNVWATYGGYNQFGTFNYHNYGFSKFNPQTGWLNVPYSKVDGALDLVRITVDPQKSNRVFISSYFSGLLKFEDDVLIAHYTDSNSGLEAIEGATPAFKPIVVEQSVFDKAGNLWMTNGLQKNVLKVFKKDGTWQGYNMESILGGNYFNSRFGRLTIDKNGTKWMSTLSDGLVGFNEKGNLFRKITMDPGNLPDAAVQVAAIDNRNQIWIGTRKGLRVLSSVDRFFNGNLTANPIIILEDGVAQELMYQQFITDIVVDGANNKWIGTLDAGVFLFSSNGQETIHHFTSSNSPLPSNAINDIDINQDTGEVFFATINGMVSFKGTALKSSDNLDNVVVYPNPVRPEFQGTVKITGLMDKANVKISDVEGNLVHEVTAEGGSTEWDTTAFGRYKVKSGVYLIFISSDDAATTKVKKVMIVR